MNHFAPHTGPWADTARRIERIGYRVNYITERICALLVAAMILVVWFGIVERYFLALGVTWTEELARYIMIWAALLAVPCCTHRREHIGLDLLFSKFPLPWQPVLRLTLDALGIAFFLFLAWYGVGMTRQGTGQLATIFGMNMVLPFLSVPVTCALTVFQIMVCMVRDSARLDPTFAVEEAQA